MTYHDNKTPNAGKRPGSERPRTEPRRLGYSARHRGDRIRRGDDHIQLRGTGSHPDGEHPAAGR